MKVFRFSFWTLVTVGSIFNAIIIWQNYLSRTPLSLMNTIWITSIIIFWLIFVFIKIARIFENKNDLFEIENKEKKNEN